MLLYNTSNLRERKILLQKNFGTMKNTPSNRNTLLKTEYTVHCVTSQNFIF